MSNDNVVGIRPDIVLTFGKPNADLIKELEELLEMARAGQALGMAYTIFEHDNAVEHNVVGVLDRHMMLGALEIVKYRLVEDIITEVPPLTPQLA